MKHLLSILVFTLVSCTAAFAEYTFGQYNIRILTNDDTGDQMWSNRKTYVAALVREYGFDVCSMNEIKAGTQYNNLKDLLPEYSFYAHSVTSTTIEERETMNAVAWKTDKFDMLDKGVWFISCDPLNTARVISDSRQSRNTVWVKLQDKETKEIFFYFATHLDHVGWDARREGAKINIDMVRKTAGNYPSILGGDHNAGAGESRVDKPMQTYFKSAGTECPPADGKLTTHAGFVTEVAVGGTPIDYLYGHNVNIKSYTIIRDNMGNPAGIPPSDHFALMSKMELKPYISCRRQCVSSNIQEAINAAEAGDTILIAAGTINESIKVTKSLTLIGGYNDDFTEVTGRTTLDGTDKNFSHIITVDPNTYCEIQNINVCGGNATTSGDDIGGGICSKAWYLTLTNCDITNNLATDKGGGVYALYQMQATNCKFIGNRATNRGGAFCTNSSSTWRYTFNNCLFSDNRATTGGAGYITGMIRGYFKGNTFANNTARKTGGALYLGNKDKQTLSLTMLNNTFVSNSISLPTGEGQGGAKGGSVIYAELYKDAEAQTASTTLNLVANSIVGNNGSTAINVVSGYLGLYNNIIAGNKGGDVTLTGDLMASANNAYTSAASLNGITVGQTDIIGTDEASSFSDLTSTFNAVVEGDTLKPSLSDDEIPMLYIRTPSFAGKSIISVASTWTSESKLKADLNDDTAIMTQKYTDDQRGATRKAPYTIGAVEYNESLGINDIHNSQRTIHNAQFNLQGVRVNDNYKGIVIKNGKKHLVK